MMVNQSIPYTRRTRHRNAAPSLFDECPDLPLGVWAEEMKNEMFSDFMPLTLHG